jgi:hypothetical protein
MQQQHEALKVYWLQAVKVYWLYLCSPAYSFSFIIPRSPGVMHVRMQYFARLLRLHLNIV